MELSMTWRKINWICSKLYSRRIHLHCWSKHPTAKKL